MLDPNKQKQEKAKPEVPPGATEDQVNMAQTNAQRLDKHGTRVEDVAGTGEHDAPGG